jgi:hypothetical protein
MGICQGAGQLTEGIKRKFMNIYVWFLNKRMDVIKDKGRVKGICITDGYKK